MISPICQKHCCQMRSAFYFLYFTIALVSADCNPPPNTAGLTLETGVFMNLIADNMEPAYSCECDVGVRYFWDSSNTSVPNDAEKWIRISTGTYNDCKNLCIRSEEGICYTPATPYVKIYFISYCKDKNCHVYTIMYPPHTMSSTMKKLTQRKLTKNEK